MKLDGLHYNLTRACLYKTWAGDTHNLKLCRWEIASLRKEKCDFIRYTFSAHLPSYETITDPDNETSTHIRSQMTSANPINKINISDHCQSIIRMTKLNLKNAYDLLQEIYRRDARRGGKKTMRVWPKDGTFTDNSKGAIRRGEIYTKGSGRR